MVECDLCKILYCSSLSIFSIARYREYFIGHGLPISYFILQVKINNNFFIDR